MTELEWLRCTKLRKMLLDKHLVDIFSERKLYLFACACCRRLWDLVPDVLNQSVIELAEKHADGDLAHELAIPSWRHEKTLKSYFVNRKAETLIRVGVDETRARIAVRHAALATHQLTDTWPTFSRADANRIADNASFAVHNSVPE